MTCEHSGCNHPEGECSGACLTKTFEMNANDDPLIAIDISNPNDFISKAAAVWQAKNEAELNTAWKEFQKAKQAKFGNPSPLASQVGGQHYKDMKIQPLEYCHANNIGKIEGDVIAYVSRWRKKNGVEDLRKAVHELEILIELEARRG